MSLKVDLPQDQTTLTKYNRYNELYLKGTLRTIEEEAEFDGLFTELEDYLITASDFNGKVDSGHLSDTLANGVHGLDTTVAKFKTGSYTFTDNDTSQIFTDAFCTTTSLVVISITGTTPQGIWTVTSGDGNFTITSTVAESSNVTFDYYIIKAVV